MKEAVVLREREKELACIYSICLLAAGAPEPGSAAEGIARALCAAMSAEPMAACSIRLEKGEERVELRRGGRGSPTEAGRPRMAAALRAEDSGGWKGEIAVEYLDPSLAFLPQEKALLDSVLVVTASMLRTASLIAELRAISEDLRSKNTALREILSMIEEERSRMLEAFRERLSAEILPLAERSRDPNLSPERREAYAGLLAEELKRGISSLGPGPDEAPALSPREREVAIQVRNGRTSKEIAELLGIAEATVERHRHNIRRKLRIAGQAINLTTLLGSSEARGSIKFKDSL
ncbi:MAG TPA: LuxR C-terminal-related transcriptional regulator [Spirochaetia bacterium]|nr:LuxR C-terminal-related transcriptional regulator [Spirochaetia bacterium]HRZ65739.1 LuxR C-terminal-related transcriptional regulator [Spirochaetia bacterium]